MRRMFFKRIFFSMTSVILLAPFLARAQWRGWQDLEFESDLPGSDLGDLLRNFMMWFLGIFGFVGIIGFLISGFQYLLAAGDESQLEKAKASMKWSLVGVVVGLAGFILIYAVDQFLRGSSSF
ncbi:MAG TPA: hypothetical protein VJL38_00045 [Patescibacteria group bacterium]|nr:hypothetical protein [Patescibacteria group bacterium]